jgi:hypothetical protein
VERDSTPRQREDFDGAAVGVVALPEALQRKRAAEHNAQQAL